MDLPCESARADALIVHVITRYARGGSERRVLDSLAATEDMKTLVVVGAESDPDAVAELSASTEVMWAPKLVRDVSLARDTATMVFLVRLFRELKPTVVQTHQSKAGALGRVAATLTGVPHMYHSVSMAAFGPGYSRVQSVCFRYIAKFTHPCVDRYFIVGRDLAGLLLGAGVPASKMSIVRSSIDRTRFPRRTDADRTAARAEYGIDPAAWVVGFVGSLEERKGIASLPAHVPIAPDGRRTVLLVAGEGPLRDVLDAAKVPGLDIVLLGQVDDPARVMTASDVVALPSSAEGLPQVLVQAAMCGVPFVAFDVDGVQELIDLGAVGRRVPLGDFSTLTKALAELLERPRGADEAPPAETWRAWEPATVAATYREFYEQDFETRSWAKKLHGAEGPQGSSWR